MVKPARSNGKMFQRFDGKFENALADECDGHHPINVQWNVFVWKMTSLRLLLATCRCVLVAAAANEERDDEAKQRAHTKRDAQRQLLKVVKHNHVVAEHGPVVVN